MSDIVLRSSVRAHVELTRLGDALKQLPERLREQDGQDTIEYIGVLLVVAALIGIVIGVVPGLGSTIQQGAETTMKKVFDAKSTSSN